jgi:FkbM family methyltransferase
MNTPDDEFTNVILKQFPAGHKGLAIECGANDGIADSPCYLLEVEHNWNCINIEANPYCKPLLKKNRPNARNLFCGLAGKECVKNLFIPSRYATRRELAGGATFYKKIQEGKELEKKRVYCMTYEKLISIYNLKNQHIDLFVLDVEGYERQIILNMAKTDTHPDVFVVEHSHSDDFSVELSDMGYKQVDSYKDNWIMKKRRLL